MGLKKKTREIERIWPTNIPNILYTLMRQKKLQETKYHNIGIAVNLAIYKDKLTTTS